MLVRRGAVRLQDEVNWYKIADMTSRIPLSTRPVGLPPINVNWETLGGAVVFTGTEVLLQTVLQTAHHVQSFEELREQFPFLTRTLFQSALAFAKEFPDMVARPIRPGATTLE